MKKPVSVPWGYRLGVLSRCLAASLGGYALANAASALIAGMLPGNKASAAVAGMMLGFVLYLVAVLWVFACRSAGRAWLGLVMATLVLGGADLALYRMSTP